MSNFDSFARLARELETLRDALGAYSESVTDENIDAVADCALGALNAWDRFRGALDLGALSISRGRAGAVNPRTVKYCRAELRRFRFGRLRKKVAGWFRRSPSISSN